MAYSSFGTQTLGRPATYSGATAPVTYSAAGAYATTAARTVAPTTCAGATTGYTSTAARTVAPTTYAGATTGYTSAAARTLAPTTYSGATAPVTYSATGAYATTVAPTTYAGAATGFTSTAARVLTSTQVLGAPQVIQAYSPAAVVSQAPTEPQGNFKVCVVGGAGGIGQPLSLLMAQCPLVSELAIIDLNIAAVPAEGVQADLSHIEGKCKVTSTVLVLNEDKAIDKAGDALTGCDLVLVPAGVPRKPGQDRKDLLNINCDIAKGTVEACAKFCPNAVVGLIVNPVNSVVPAMIELWKKAGLDSRKIVGISTLDVVRANKFVQELTGSPASIPVIGGHAGKTILPIFSQDPAGATIPADMIPELDERVQNAGTEVVKAKNGKGSATLSMAYSGARLGKAVLSGLAGVPVTECAYVESNVIEGCPYFASQVVFGREGVEQVLDIGILSAHEENRLAELVPILREEIQDGLDYASVNEFGQ